jgi:hypothetical protein
MITYNDHASNWYYESNCTAMLPWQGGKQCSAQWFACVDSSENDNEVLAFRPVSKGSGPKCFAARTLPMAAGMAPGMRFITLGRRGWQDLHQRA